MLCQTSFVKLKTPKLHLYDRAPAEVWLRNTIPGWDYFSFGLVQFGLSTLSETDSSTAAVLFSGLFVCFLNVQIRRRCARLWIVGISGDELLQPGRQICGRNLRALWMQDVRHGIPPSRASRLQELLGHFFSIPVLHYCHHSQHISSQWQSSYADSLTRC